MANNHNCNNVEAFVAITELIGEMGWGIGLDIEVPVAVQYIPRTSADEPELQPIQTVTLHPKSMEPVFDSIYRRLVNSQHYNPMRDLKRNSDLMTTENHRLDLIVKALEKDLSKLTIERDDAIERAGILKNETIRLLGLLGDENDESR